MLLNVVPILYTRLVDLCNHLVGGSGGAFSLGFSSAFDIEAPGRIYPVVPYQNTALPFITYSVTSMKPDACLRGQVQTMTASVDVACVAVSEEEARSIAEAVADGLHGYRDVDSSVLGCLMSDGATSATDDDPPGYIYGLTFEMKIRTNG